MKIMGKVGKVNMKTCKHCNKEICGSHYCNVAGRNISEDSDGDFLLSAIVGYATNSAIIGGLIGGDVGGSILGDIMNDGNLFD